jgi:Mn2+/Fe2+ NRAMP family transporter
LPTWSSRRAPTGACKAKDSRAPARSPAGGSFTAPRWLTAIAVVIAATVIGLNVKLLTDLALG